MVIVPVAGVTSSGELLCPSGQYQPGASPSLTGFGCARERLQTLSGPTKMTSDEAGRAMYGGWVIIPKQWHNERGHSPVHSTTMFETQPTRAVDNARRGHFLNWT